MDQLAKEALDHDIDPLTTVHFADLKPLVNSYIQQEVQIKWDVSIHGRDLYLLKPTLGPPKRFRHLTRAEEVVITRLRIGLTKATKSLSCPEDRRLLAIILARLWPLNTCPWNVQCCNKVVMSTTQLTQRTLFETIPEACIIEFLREAGFFYLIWMAIYPIQFFIQISHQLTTLSSWINPHYWTPPLDFVYRA